MMNDFNFLLITNKSAKAKIYINAFPYQTAIGLMPQYISIRPAYIMNTSQAYQPTGLNCILSV